MAMEAMGKAIVLRGDARQLPLPDACVDLIVTSPPYFGLRSYTDGGEHYDGQIGGEATPGEWLAALQECTREWVRVLKPEGSLFVNLGDSYYSGKGSPGKTTIDAKSPARTARRTMRSPLDYGLDYPRKSLLGLPWRYAIGCTDQLGLILRAEIIWQKPNGLPESVTDRVRRAHEQIFHFTRQPRYYAAVDEIREPHVGVTGGNDRRPFKSGNGLTHRSGNKDYDLFNPLGKLPGSVWPIPSSPLVVPAHLGVDHFAAFPPALVRPLVLGWSPPGVCTGCGQGRRPIVDRVNRPLQRVYNGTLTKVPGQGRQDCRNGVPSISEATITGYTCACTQPTAPTKPAVVLDPFAGTGTTMLVASAYGRVGVGVDRSMDYARLAQWRVHDPGERARARDLPKPPPIPDGMEPLFPLTW